MCIGRRLSLLEMQLLLSRIDHRFKLEVEYPDGEYVGRVTRVTTVPDRPLRIKFLDRCETCRGDSCLYDARLCWQAPTG